MGDFYQDMQNVAADVLRDFNQGVIDYIAVTPGNGPANNPGAPTETAYRVNGVMRGVMQKYVDDVHIVASDLQLTFPGGVVEPANNGFVRVGGTGGTRYKIVQIVRTPAIGTAVSFTLIVRK